MVENTAGKKPFSFLDKDNVTLLATIDIILEEYKYRPSELSIKKAL